MEAGTIYAAVFNGADCECFDDWSAVVMTQTTSCDIICSSGEPSYCGGTSGKSVYHAFGNVIMYNCVLLCSYVYYPFTLNAILDRDIIVYF